jgi:pilus assembly protein Flp/PilA
MVKLTQPVGQPDLEIINVTRKLRGLPPGQMEWVCQHSCAAETIPDCQDVNCEGTLIVGQGDVEDLRGLVARGELAVFEGVPVQVQLDLPRGVGAALQRFVQGSAELPVIRRQTRGFTASGSLLAFARLCARRLNPRLSAGASNVLREIEQVLTWEFSCGGPALFQQRFVDLRTHTACGQGLVEYALILVLIAVIVIGVLSTLGAQTSRVFDQVNCALGTLSHQDNGNGNSNRCN